MTDFLTRLEQATEGSRELGDEVLLAAGWFVDTMTVQGCGVKEVEIWCHPDGAGAGSFETANRPNPTTSLDAALTLVPEGWRVYAIQQEYLQQHSGWFAGLDAFPPAVYEPVLAKAPTPALALCIAALRARG